MAPRTKDAIASLRKDKMLHIEKIALKLFAENGYHATSIASIAKQAEISKGLLYNYYSSKEELLKSLVFRVFEDMLKVFDFESDSKKFSFNDQILKMIDAGFEWVKKNQQSLKIYFGIMLQPAVLIIINDEMWKMAAPYFEKAARFFASSGYSNPLVEVRYFNSMLDGIFLNYVLEPESYPLEEMKQKVINQYIKPL
ncbi:MAG: TetR/AcrR family transcriptional regulator [Marinilabiliaceae bacterium]|nr:TetR/AcrR family transcriptional regulator [Marinilabiliaceae bacterium]